MKKIFLTGGTGFLGGYLSYLLIQKGFHVTLLVRASRFLTGEEKFYRTLKTLFPRPDLEMVKKHTTFVTGDVLKYNLGIKRGSGSWDILVHCASSTDFSEENFENLRHTNVDGAGIILDFAKRHKIPSFHYVSTAYASGVAPSPVQEVVQKPSAFRNFYEDTKNQAEHICVRFAKENGLKLTIHRPSIIVGEVKEGRTLNFEGPYLFMKQLSKFQSFYFRRFRLLKNKNIKLELQLPSLRSDTHNLVPVDYVASFMTAVIERPELEGEVYHITNDFPPTAAELSEIFRKFASFQTVKFLGDEGFDVDSKESAIYMEGMKAYWPYLTARVSFDRAHARKVEQVAGITPPHLKNDDWQRIFKYALETNFGKRPYHGKQS